MVSSKPFVGPSPRTKISFSLSTCTEELLSTPKITTFLNKLPFDHENCERTSTPSP